MDFYFYKSTPANTAKKDALKIDLKLTKGTITRVSLFHPEGCHGLAYAAILHGKHQRYPRNSPDAYHGNDVPMITEDNYKLGEPALLKLVTWNTDDTYAHGVFVHITVLRIKKDPLAQAMVDLLSIIKTLLTGRRVS